MFKGHMGLLAWTTGIVVAACAYSPEETSTLDTAQPTTTNPFRGDGGTRGPSGNDTSRPATGASTSSPPSSPTSTAPNRPPQDQDTTSPIVDAGGFPADANSPVVDAGNGHGSADASGSQGTATTDAAMDCVTAPFCEGFESSGSSFSPLWAVGSPNCSGSGTATVDSTVAHTGTRSAKVTGGGSYCNHIFLSTRAISTLGPQVFVRFFFRLDKPFGSGQVNFLAMKERAQGKDLRFGGHSQVLVWNRESDGATLPELSPAGLRTSLAPSPNAWHCAEFHVDGATGNLTTWLDGAVVAGLSADGVPTTDVDARWLGPTPWRPTLEDFRIGWEDYGNYAGTIWYDDIAFANQRLGCSP